MSHAQNQQNQRYLAIETALGPDAFVVTRLSGAEEMSSPFRFTLDLTSEDAAIDPTALLGQPARVTIALPSGGERIIHGRVHRFCHVGRGTARATYRAELVPWLWSLSLSTDCRIFQHLSVPEIVTQLFDEFDHRDYVLRLVKRYPKREFCVQYRETHLAFVSRLLEDEGIFYHFEHEAERHVLVLGDSAEAAQACEGLPCLRAAPHGAARWRDDVYTELAVERAMHTHAVALTDYNYLTPSVSLGASLAGGDGVGEAFDYPGDYADVLEGERYARLRLEGVEAERETAAGAGTAPALTSGYTVGTAGSGLATSTRTWLVLGVTHTAWQSVDLAREAGAGGDAGHEPGWPYRNTFTLVPADVPWRPPRRTPRPRVYGTQPALVVGVKGEEITTDVHGRVKLHFYWDRRSQRDENSSCWVRCSSAWAGTRWGEFSVPRIGQEVLVDFLEGDPDRPVVVGRVSNAEQMPSAFSQSGSLPSNHALAGWKSRELGGGAGYNEWMFDDTAGELRTKLSSEHATTQLNEGFLTHPRVDGGAEPRGEGWELRTDGWGALRGAKGIIVTADGRARAVGGQLDRSELVACLEEALKLARSLGDQAGRHRADAGDRAPQQTLAESARDWGSGSNAEPNGGGAGGTPIVGVSAPAGIALTTPRAITSFSGEHTDLVAQKNHQLTSGQRTSINAGTGVSVYADSGGIRSIANRGEHLTQAQHDDVVINADKSVRITASHNHILAVADKHITLICGGAYVKLGYGNIELGCPGTLRMKASNYVLTGPASLAEELPTFDVGETDLRYVLTYDAEREQPVGDTKYRVTLNGGEVVEGVTDADGRTAVLEKDTMRIADIEVLRPRE